MATPVRLSLSGPAATAGSCLVLFAASLVLRLLNLGRRDLTLDETWSYFLAQGYSLKEILSPFTEILYSDVHPPLFYVICKLWRVTGYGAVYDLTGDMEFAFRLPFAVINAAVAPVLFLIGRRLHGSRLGWVLGSLHVVNSYSIQMVHQTRMYPVVELLAVIGILSWLAFRERSDSKAIWALATCSILMLLTQYLCAFYLMVLWAMVGYAGRRRPFRVLTALLVAALGFAWWSPALLHQLQTESAAAGSSGSSILIIPYTLYQFLLGDRSLTYATTQLSGLNGATVAVFSIVGLGTVWAAWRERDRLPHIAGIGLLGVGSIGLLWIGTFFVPRVFYATYYAIFALPALLVVAGAVLAAGRRGAALFGSAILLLVVVANLSTLTAFYDNTLFPYEPWKAACREVRDRQIDRVAVYTPHLEPLIRLYGNGLIAEPLPYACSDWSPKLHDCDAKEPVALVISHDRGQGDCYAEQFRNCFGPAQERISLHGIEMSFFGAGS
ncbi:hypothetical protein D3OALGA1CA_4 [Olavius algarvensis associated proteobacterium Delta 3]|nr:hypothetical protein D3OALGA1CA_4 [Olavius algarvensis associated proteobacterium Delta 3]CAB5099260.1 hypothetical protein D3OALGB2SA_1718 [Olavius algarvensis associated proteobacterium Delta 3]